MAERGIEGVSHKGKLTTIFGPMFSGKSGRLIDEIERHSYGGRFGILIKPSNDNRYSEDEVATHSGRKLQAFKVDKENPEEMLNVLKEMKGNRFVNIVAIDEAQFFDPTKLVSTIKAFLEEGRDVILSGLAADSADNPFGAMPQLIAMAEETIHLTAFCTYVNQEGNICGQVATKTQRKRQEGSQILVGAGEIYAASCTDHHRPKSDWPGVSGRHE